METPRQLFDEYQTPQLDSNKLKAAVHYICYRAPNPNKLGATKLNKILFYSDMQAYLDWGTPITGEVYVKRQHGPVSLHVRDMVRQLQEEHALAVSEASGYHVYTGQRYRQRSFYSLKAPDVSVFNGAEMQTLDYMVEVICNKHSARSISEHSHDTIWELAEYGETIPYYTVCYNLLRKPDASAIEWAHAQIASAQNAAA